MIATSTERAKKRFPRTPVQHITGAGEHVLVFKCRIPWRVRLFTTVQARDEAYNYYDGNGCGAPSGCTHDHQKITL